MSPGSPYPGVDAGTVLRMYTCKTMYRMQMFTYAHPGAVGCMLIYVSLGTWVWVLTG